MSNNLQMNISVQILEHNHILHCAPHERELLMNAAELLDFTLRDFRNQNPKLALDKLMILGGVHLAFTLLQEQQTFSREVALVNQISGRLTSALDQTISNDFKAEEN